MLFFLVSFIFLFKITAYYVTLFFVSTSFGQICVRAKIHYKKLGRKMKLARHTKSKAKVLWYKEDDYP